MRLFLHPHDREELPVEIILSADEADRWIAQLQLGVRNVREGQGEQLLLFGEPARMVVTVQERADPHRRELETRYFPRARGPVPQLDLVMAMGRAGIVIVLALIVVALFLILAFRILP